MQASSQTWRPCESCISPQRPALATSSGSLFSHLASRTPEPCFRRVGAFLEADICFRFSVALEECRKELLVQPQYLRRAEWQEPAGLHGLSRSALAFVRVLLSTDEASWHSPVWINAFLFISSHVPQRQNWKCAANGFVHRMKASHNWDRSLPRSWDWGFEKHTKDLRYDFFFLRGYPLAFSDSLL